MTDICVPAVFRCRNLIWESLVWLVLFVFCVLASFAVLPLEGMQAALSIFFISFLVFAFIEYLTFTRLSDIVISDQGISKSLFGRKWRTIRWENVRKIETFLIPRFSKAPIRAYYVHQSHEQPFKSITIGFTNEMDDISAILQLVSRQIANYEVKVKIRVDGVETSLARLVSPQS